MKTKIYSSFIFFIFLGLTLMQSQELKKTKDYPGINRMENAQIKWYQQKNFDRYYILYVKDQRIHNKQIEGKILRFQYVLPKTVSVYEAFKYYEQLLKNQGFDILLELDKTNCGVNLSEYLYIGEFSGLNALPHQETIKPDFREDKFAYIEAKKILPDKTVYVVVYITEYGEPLVTLDIIEVKRNPTACFTPEQIGQQIKDYGHFSLYIKENKTLEKEPECLANLAGFLISHKNDKFYLVGHTDRSLGQEKGQKISIENARFIKNTLVNKYSVNPDQLKIKGVGSICPQASNETEEGRKLNNRVEIVRQ